MKKKVAHKGQGLCSKFDFKKLYSILAINLSILILLIGFLCYHNQCNIIPIPICLFIGLILGEIVFLAHGWRKIDSKLSVPSLLWITILSSHLIYFFMACIVFLIINSILFGISLPLLTNHFIFEVFVALGVGVTISLI